MLSIFTFIISGVAVGYLLRDKTFKSHVGSIINVIIIVLLFFLGIAVGANKQIVESFATIGLDAFAIAFACTVGSVVCAWFVFNRFFKKKNHKS
ncbi:MAG TPA: LysO family transporter [Dysgonamonadaceae bacterium]|nr:LysO family transporter [Dysgonamonadaceae bacterium]